MGFKPKGFWDAIINLTLSSFIVFGMLGIFKDNFRIILGCGFLLLYNQMLDPKKREVE